MTATFSLLVGQVGVGEAANPREERRAECWHACHVETEGHGTWLFGAVKSCLEVQNGQSG